MGHLIESKRVYLRKLKIKDASKKYCKWLNDPEVNEYLETRKATIKDLKEYISEKNKTKDCLFFGIFDKKNDKHIGNLKLEPIDFKKGVADFSIMIGEKDYWNIGIGTDATKLIVDYTFNTLGLNTIELGVIPENKVAVKVYKKCGFKIKEVQKKVMNHDGKLYDRVVMEIKKKKKVLAVIQVRMGSSRFPGKMLKKINDNPLIWYIINAVKKSQLVDEIVLATTNKEEDKILLEKAKEYGINSFVGSEEDVLDRFYQASKKFKGEVIVRLTGDCPLHDSEIIDNIVRKFLDNNADYVSNVHPCTYPDGLDTEVFSFNSLESAWNNAKLNSEREHVTPYLYNNKELFKVLNVENKEDLSNLRWTVDEQEDLEFVRKVLRLLNGKEINLKNTLRIIKRNSHLKNINKKYKRNEGYSIE